MADREPSPGPPLGEATFEEVWQEHHQHLVGLATRILGDRAAAEDVTQEAFSRLMALDLEEIRDVRGWLTVVVRRLCLNRLRSAYSRREQATDNEPLELGPPAPAAASWPGTASGLGADPADRLTLDDQVRSALSVVLDELSPAERTAFLLHDVFGLPHEAVARTVGRTPAACRQLASRGRRAVQAAAPERDGPVEMSRADDLVVERFLAACSHGNLDDLAALLHPDVGGHAYLPDGQLLGDFTGREPVARNVMVRFGPGSDAEVVPVPVEDRPGAVFLRDGRVQAVARFEIVDGLIHHIHAVVTEPDHRPRQGRVQPPTGQVQADEDRE